MPLGGYCSVVLNKLDRVRSLLVFLMQNSLRMPYLREQLSKTRLAFAFPTAPRRGPGLIRRRILHMRLLCIWGCCGRFGVVQHVCFIVVCVCVCLWRFVASVVSLLISAVWFMRWCVASVVALSFVMIRRMGPAAFASLSSVAGLLSCVACVLLVPCFSRFLLLLIRSGCRQTPPDVR